MDINNLIIIPLLGNLISSSSQPVQHSKPIVYTSDELKCIRDSGYHNLCYRLLPGQTCKFIRSLRINKKRKRRSKVGLNTKNIELYRSVNLGNLIKINTNKSPHNQADQTTVKNSAS